MPCILTSRRNLVALAGRAVLSAAAIGSLSKEAAAEQGNMEAALRALHSALESLRAATPNKGGHKEIAVQLVQQAIGEVQAGIQWANEHGGG